MNTKPSTKAANEERIKLLMSAIANAADAFDARVQDVSISTRAPLQAAIIEKLSKRFPTVRIMVEFVEGKPLLRFKAVRSTWHTGHLEHANTERMIADLEKALIDGIHYPVLDSVQAYVDGYTSAWRERQDEIDTLKRDVDRSRGPMMMPMPFPGRW